MRKMKRGKKKKNRCLIFLYFMGFPIFALRGIVTCDIYIGMQEAYSGHVFLTNNEVKIDTIELNIMEFFRLDIIAALFLHYCFSHNKCVFFKIDSSYRSFKSILYIINIYFDLNGKKFFRFLFPHVY